MAKIHPLTRWSISPTTLARSRSGVNIVPMMNGISIRVSPRDCPAMVRLVRRTVAAKPQRRMEGRIRGRGCAGSVPTAAQRRIFDEILQRDPRAGENHGTTLHLRIG